MSAARDICGARGSQASTPEHYASFAQPVVRGKGGSRALSQRRRRWANCLRACSSGAPPKCPLPVFRNQSWAAWRQLESCPTHPVEGVRSTWRGWSREASDAALRATGRNAIAYPCLLLAGRRRHDARALLLSIYPSFIQYRRTMSGGVRASPSGAPSSIALFDQF